jgi:hypothetical protein
MHHLPANLLQHTPQQLEIAQLQLPSAHQARPKYTTHFGPYLRAAPRPPRPIMVKYPRAHFRLTVRRRE